MKRFVCFCAGNGQEAAARSHQKEEKEITYTFKGLDHVQLAAPPRAEEQARRFYGEILGLQEIPKPKKLQARGGVWFRLGEQEIHIGIEEPFVPARKAHPAFHVNGLELLMERLRTYQIELTEDDAIPGVKRFFVSDPFGNRLEFLEKGE